MSANSFHSITVPGTQVVKHVPITGTLFVCKEATARFKIQFNDGEKMDFEGGFSIRLPEGFTRVTFYNLDETTEVDLVVDFYAGDSTVEFNYVRQPRTRTKATEVSLGSGDATLLRGTDEGNRRQAITITNTDSANNLRIVDAATDTAMGTVYPQSSWQWETDADIKLLAPSGAITAQVGEIFYRT